MLTACPNNQSVSSDLGGYSMTKYILGLPVGSSLLVFRGISSYQYGTLSINDKIETILYISFKINRLWYCVQCSTTHLICEFDLQQTLGFTLSDHLLSVLRYFPFYFQWFICDYYVRYNLISNYYVIHDAVLNYDVTRAIRGIFDLCL